MKKYLKESKIKTFAKILKDYIEDTTDVPITIDKDRIITKNIKQPYPFGKSLFKKSNSKKEFGDIDKDNVLNKHRLKK